MARSFRGDPVDPLDLEHLCAHALRAPTAGNAAGVRMTVVPTEHVAQYFAVATDAHWRTSSARYPGLSRAGAVVLVTSRPQDYLERYAEADKSPSGLSSKDVWTVPYWHTDAAMATMALLLLLEERRLGAVFWGNFRHEAEVLQWASEGKISAHVHAVYPLEEIANALKALAARRVMGKLVVHP